MDKHNEEHLQAYLSGELSLSKRQTMEESFADDAIQYAQCQRMKDEEDQILAHIHALQIHPSEDDVALALLRFHQQSASTKRAVLGETDTRPTNTGTTSHWWQRLSQRWQDQMAFGMATCVALGVVLLSQVNVPKAPIQGASWTKLIVKHSTPHQLRAKGTQQPAEERTKAAYLYLGTVAESGKVTRLGAGETCFANQQLFFALRLKTAGYPYLFLRDKEATRQLYPFTKTPKRWARGYQEILRDGIPQLYQLKRHQGPITFVLLWSPTPLPQAEIKRLRQGCLSQKAGGLSCSSFRDSAPYSLDAIPLRILPEARHGHTP